MRGALLFRFRDADCGLSGPCRRAIPAVPPETGTAPFVGPSWDAYRCVGGPITNFYHGAYYGGEPPALYRGYAYRPYYRYGAYRRQPRTYFCVTD